jgi:predicted dienelactone hydrolase
LAIARTSDALGALAFIAGQTFVDPQRVAAVGFSKGGWTALLVSESNDSFSLFVRPSNLKFRAAVAFNPPCSGVGARPLIPTLILIGTLDEWTPAAHCSEKNRRLGHRRGAHRPGRLSECSPSPVANQPELASCRCRRGRWPSPRAGGRSRGRVGEGVVVGGVGLDQI